LKNSAGTSIPGTVTLSTSGDAATFKPSSALSYSASYTAAATSGIKDLAGNLLTPKSWSFTTAAAPTSSCGDNLALVTATSSGSQSSYPATNAIDNNFNTKWYSTFTTNPWIQLDLGTQKSVCSVDIAWADGASRQYSFVISVSTDGTSFTNVFTGKSSGTSTSPQKYNFAESQAKYVKITITQSHAGTTSSIAQISEIDVFGKASSTSTSTASSATTTESTRLSVTSDSESQDAKGSSATDDNNNGKNKEPANNSASASNRAPAARNDLVVTKSNNPVLVAVLENDNDPDGDKLEIVSLTSTTRNGAFVTLNDNGTVTFSPPPDFAGVDKFSYIISDGKVKSDVAQVSVVVKRVADDISKRDQTEPLKTGKEQQQQEQQTGQGDDVIVPLKNLDDSSVTSKGLKAKSVQNAGRDNDTSASKP
jgi:hypothetical protein